MNSRVTILPAIQRGDWLFRVSTLEDPKQQVYSIMIVIWYTKRKNSLYVRYFDDEAKAAKFVEECSSGKYGVILK